jgi:hypothetical protein
VPPGYDGVTEIVKVLRHEETASSVPKEVLLTPIVATQANMNDPSVKKYFYLPTCGPGE